MLCRLARNILGLAIAAPAALCHWPVAATAQERIVDSFEADVLDTRLWGLSQASSDRVWIDHHEAAFGRSSLAIEVKPGDEGRFCHARCQRMEVREARALQLPSGSDVWYAFSFKLSGDIPRRGSTRWVVGQWKQETAAIDPSPFLAQRFDNGVFHVTIEDNGCRTAIASAEGDFNTASLATGELPLKGVWAGLGLLEPEAPVSCSTDIGIQPGAASRLPNPHGSWVRMVYHMRAALDGQGLVEVYANGDLVVRANGSIGYPTRAGARQYFKIGQYRDVMPGEAILYFDCFVRSLTREGAFDTSGCGPAAAPRP